jgi:biotin transporter BioY
MSRTHRALTVLALSLALATATATVDRGLDPLAVLLLGLVGGLAVGAAAMAGWTAHRQHAHRVVAA